MSFSDLFFFFSFFSDQAMKATLSTQISEHAPNKHLFFTAGIFQCADVLAQQL